MNRYTIQEKIAYSFIGKTIAKVIRKFSSKHKDSRLHWIQQEMAEFGIK